MLRLRRLAGAGLVALMVSLTAVTPLTAITSGGAHEMWLDTGLREQGHSPLVRVSVLDATGLVAGIAPAEWGTSSTPTRILAVWYGNCWPVGAVLHFGRAADGYRLTTSDTGCFFGPTLSVALLLNRPIDPTKIEYIGGFVT